MYEIKRYHFSQISSTNDYARELLAGEKRVAVTAEYQWSGRGRGDKTWEGESGLNVYCSIGMRYDRSPVLEELIALQAQGCLAVQTTLAAIAPHKRFALKYPNDVLMQTEDRTWKKVCGVLVEHEFSGARCLTSIVGIGVNVRQRNFPPALRERATSLLNEGVNVAVDTVTEGILREWSLLSQRAPADILEEWKRELRIEGKILEIVGEGAGWQSVSLMSDGRLRARHTTTGVERLIDNGDSVRYDIGE